jgi:hypothetical protein
MASAKQRAWRKKFAKMAKSGKFRKKSSRRKSTRKGQRRKTARRAYEGLKRRTRKSYKRRKSSSGMKMPKMPSFLKKVAIGLGAATLASMAVGVFAPQYVPIARPIAAYLGGGVPGVAGELIIDNNILGNLGTMFGGASINDTRLAGGL